MLRPFWEQNQRHPTIAWTAFQALVAAGGGGSRPAVLVLGELQAPRALLVAMHETTRIPVQWGYWRIAHPEVSVLTVKHEGWLGPVDEATAVAFTAALRREMREQRATALHVDQFPVDHALVRAAMAAGAAWMRPEPDVHWRVALAATYPAFLQACSRGTRRNLKRYPERFLTEFGARSVVHVRRHPGELGCILAELDEVARRTYHRGLGAGFLRTPATCALIEAALAEGTYRAYVLHIDGKPAAFWDGRRCGSTFFTDFTGYLPEFRDARPGWYLLTRVIEDLCGDPDVDTLDFGMGDAQYKQMLGSTSAQDVSLALYAPTLRGQGLRTVLRATSGSTKLARRVLDRIGWTNKVKRLWRRRLAADGVDAAADGAKGEAAKDE